MSARSCTGSALAHYEAERPVFDLNYAAATASVLRDLAEVFDGARRLTSAIAINIYVDDAGGQDEVSVIGELVVSD